MKFSPLSIVEKKNQYY